MIRCKDIFIFVLTTLAFSACIVRDDIPYPIVEGAITAFEVEGQCDAEGNDGGTVEINSESRTIKVYVNDLANLSDLKVNRLEVTNDALVIKDNVVYGQSDKYSTKGYSQSNKLSNLRGDFTHDATFIIRTYQDYEWTVKVKQIVKREVEIDGQVGKAVIDTYTRTAIIYVSDKNDLQALKVRKFTLGGQHGTVTPDPTAQDTYDFSGVCRFSVQEGWSKVSNEWKVYVYTTEAEAEATASIFPRSVSALVSGEIPNGTSPKVEYRSQGQTDWQAVPDSQIRKTSTTYETEITGLQPGTTYECRVTAGSSTTSVQTFSTVAVQQLENAGFERWSSIMGSSGKELYQPWGEGETPYWGTGNAGATTVGASNSTYVDEGGRRYANLQSKYIVIKFAAGNIFTGEYLKTDGSNGILGFGRPFTSFPTKLRFDYKYHSETINRTGGDWKSAYGKYITQELYESLKGQPDMCNIYVALGDWPEQEYNGKKFPIIIRTRPSELSLLNLNDEHIIAYGELTKGEDVSQWTTHEIDIEYRVLNRQPKFIIIVASSSKYGDYFTGGEGSLLQIDNFELLYE